MKFLTDIGLALADAILRLLPRRWTNSLSLHVDKYVDAWQRQSRAKSKRPRGRFQRLMLWGADHPFGFVAGIAIPTAVVAVGVPELLARFWCVHIFSTPAWGRADFLTYLGAAIATQATVVALVYPLVISFITFMVQRQATAKVSLSAYLLDTGVIPSGASSFGLLLFLTATYLALSFRDGDTGQQLAVASFIWLGANLLLTVSFLRRTALFLQDERRTEVLSWFATAITLPRDVRGYVAGLLLQNAQREGWLPGPAYDATTKEPLVVPIPTRQGTPCVTVSMPRSRELVDVRFLLLARGSQLWLERANRDYKGPRSLSLRPELRYPAVPNSPATEFVLARVHNASAPGKLASLFIRLAFVFGHVRRLAMPFSTDEVLSEIATDVVTQVEQRNYPRFQKTLRDLWELHKDVLSAASAGPATDTFASAALLQSPYGFGTMTLGRDWMRSYREINNVSTRAIETDERYFGTAAHTSQTLVYRMGAEPLEVLHDALVPIQNLFYQLRRWWSERTGELTAEQTLESIRLPPSSRDKYSAAFRAWLGVWEGIDLPSKSEPLAADSEVWSYACKRVLFLASHIDFTAKSLIGSVIAGDLTGTDLLQDTLVKWWGAQEYDFDLGGVPYDADSNLVDLSLAATSFEQTASRLPAVPADANRLKFMERYLSFALMRYWEDVRVQIAVFLLDQPDLSVNERALATRVAIGVLTLEERVSGGRVSGEAIRTSWQVLKKVVRFQVAKSEYGFRLSSLFEDVRFDRRGPMIPNRIYTASVSAEMTDMLGGLTTLLVSLYQARPAALTEESTSILRRVDLNTLESAKQFVGRIREYLENRGVRDREALVLAIREELHKVGEIGEAVQAICIALESIGAFAAEHGEAVVKEAKLSEASLEVFERRCSERVFAPKGAFGLPLTTTFTPIAAALPAAERTIEGLSKRPFTEPPLETLSDYEVEGVTNWLGPCVLYEAIEGLVRQADLKDVRRQSGPMFFEDLLRRIEDIRKANGEPVVIVSQGEDAAELLSPWRSEDSSELPQGVSVRSARVVLGEDAWSYVNNVPVYQAPTASRCIVVARQQVEELEFNQLHAGSGFRLVTKEVGANKLTMTFRFAVKFRDWKSQ